MAENDMGPRTQSQAVSFRVRGRTLERLQSEARASSLSLGEVARTRLESSFEGDDPLRLLAEIQAVRQEAARTSGGVDRLRVDLVATLELILRSVANASPEDINAWLAARLHR
jgi:hypothetical protein